MRDSSKVGFRIHTILQLDFLCVIPAAEQGHPSTIFCFELKHIKKQLSNWANFSFPSIITVHFISRIFLFSFSSARIWANDLIFFGPAKLPPSVEVTAMWAGWRLVPSWRGGGSPGPGGESPMVFNIWNGFHPSCFDFLTASWFARLPHSSESLKIRKLKWIKLVFSTFQ